MFERTQSGERSLRFPSNRWFSERARQPASEEQLDYILNLLEEREVSRDSLIEVDALLDRLTFSTASHFIDTLKYMPGVDVQE